MEPLVIKIWTRIRIACQLAIQSSQVLAINRKSTLTGRRTKSASPFVFGLIQIRCVSRALMDVLVRNNADNVFRRPKGGRCTHARTIGEVISSCICVPTPSVSHSPPAVCLIAPGAVHSILIVSVQKVSLLCRFGSTRQFTQRFPIILLARSSFWRAFREMAGNRGRTRKHASTHTEVATIRRM